MTGPSAALVPRPRVLALPRYGRLGASSRLRVWQYLPWLEAAGLDVEVRPLLPDSYIEDLQCGRRKPLRLASAYAGRVRAMRRFGRCDVLWIEKELLPWIPGWIEQNLLPRDVPCVVDYDDAVYHLYEAHRSPLVRAMLGEKHAVAMREAALVIAGNATLANRAERAGASNIRIVPTVVDLDRYPLAVPRQGKEGPIRVCWIGQRSTVNFLTPYRELFASLESEGRIQFVAIGIDAAALGLPMDSLPWSEAGEAAAISSCDIGIMPLADGPFERGKCGYKLIQYMACGLPVVASPVGVNREIVMPGVNGFLAETVNEWRDALVTLAADPALRVRMGKVSRKLVEQNFSIQAKGATVAGLLQSVVAQ